MAIDLGDAGCGGISPFCSDITYLSRGVSGVEIRREQMLFMKAE
jgi:hypothetical protein